MKIRQATRPKRVTRCSKPSERLEIHENQDASTDPRHADSWCPQHRQPGVRLGLPRNNHSMCILGRRVQRGRLHDQLSECDADTDAHSDTKRHDHANPSAHDYTASHSSGHAQPALHRGTHQLASYGWRRPRRDRWGGSYCGIQASDKLGLVNCEQLQDLRLWPREDRAPALSSWH